MQESCSPRAGLSQVSTQGSLSSLERIIREKENKPNFENLTKKQKRNFKKKMRKKLKKAAAKLGKDSTMSFVTEEDHEEDGESSISSAKRDNEGLEIEDNSSTPEIDNLQVCLNKEIPIPNENTENNDADCNKVNKPPIGHREVQQLDEHVRIVIADLGNACWTHNHFTSEIQTRQ